MKKQGFGALLGVGQGSERESQLVIMQWNGAKKSTKPIALVGKGVCFDSGGLSIKVGAGMQGMKGDMAGGGHVPAPLLAPGARQAPVHPGGGVGLVGEKPEGGEARPPAVLTPITGPT